MHFIHAVEFQPIPELRSASRDQHIFLDAFWQQQLKGNTAYDMRKLPALPTAPLYSTEQKADEQQTWAESSVAGSSAFAREPLGSNSDRKAKQAAPPKVESSTCIA